MLVSPFVISSTMKVPTTALVTLPRPPPKLMPPNTAAVSTVTSRPTPMSPPAELRREAKNVAASAVRTPLVT